MRRAPDQAEPGDERAHAELEDRHARLAQFPRAKAAVGEAAHVRLELSAVERERNLRQLALGSAQSQFARHQQNLVPHNVIMKQTDL